MKLSALFIFLFCNFLPVIIVCLFIYTGVGDFLSNYFKKINPKAPLIYFYLIFLSMEFVGCILLITTFIKNVILRIRKKN